MVRLCLHNVLDILLLVLLLLCYMVLLFNNSVFLYLYNLLEMLASSWGHVIVYIKLIPCSNLSICTYSRCMHCKSLEHPLCPIAHNNSGEAIATIKLVLVGRLCQSNFNVVNYQSNLVNLEKRSCSCTLATSTITLTNISIYRYPSLCT